MMLVFLLAVEAKPSITLVLFETFALTGAEVASDKVVLL